MTPNAPPTLFNTLVRTGNRPRARALFLLAAIMSAAASSLSLAQEVSPSAPAPLSRSSDCTAAQNCAAGHGELVSALPPPQVSAQRLLPPLPVGINERRAARLAQQTKPEATSPSAAASGDGQTAAGRQRHSVEAFRFVRASTDRRQIAPIDRARALLLGSAAEARANNARPPRGSNGRPSVVTITFE